MTSANEIASELVKKKIERRSIGSNLIAAINGTVSPEKDDYLLLLEAVDFAAYRLLDDRSAALVMRRFKRVTCHHKDKANDELMKYVVTKTIQDEAYSFVEAMIIRYYYFNLDTYEKFRDDVKWFYHPAGVRYAFHNYTPYGDDTDAVAYIFDNSQEYGKLIKVLNDRFDIIEGDFYE